MLHKFTQRVATALSCGLLAVFGLGAKTGAPHTFVADASFTDVNLSWSAPSDAKELRWHDNRDYNGDTAPATDKQKSVKTYVASRFDANDLKNYVGETVEAIMAFQYRQIFSTTVYVYKNGEVIAQGRGDQSKYKKNTFLRVALDSPVVIEADAEYMFAVCYESGSNVDFVAIKDQYSNASGKGDLLSSDGKTWTATGNGEYLVTACLKNDVDEAPTGYNVYRGAEKLNSEIITDKSYKLSDQPEGSSTYYVSAVYANEEIKSAPAEVSLISVASLLPSVPTLAASVNELNVNLNWAQPLLGGNELTWSDKSFAMSIGGTASTNTKVWVRNSFDETDLIAFRGGKINAINFYFAEAVISSATIFVLKDGVIDYFEEVSADAVAAIKEKEWTKFALNTPYQLDDSHSYAYGLYVMHTPKAHPMGVDKSATINVKGNSFSTSSPSSKGFAQSKPSWKTLKSGGMEGNWMMTADIEGAPAPIAVPSYDIYRNGQLIKAGVTATSFEDAVADLGSYEYSVVSRSGDKSSLPTTCDANVKLPDAYSAPLIENYTFDPETKQFDLVWNMDKEITHSGAPKYLAGFEEEMTMMWGTQFTAAELSAYKGYTITKLKFSIGEEIGDFSVGVYAAKGVLLSKVDFKAGQIKPQAIYTVKLPTPIEITGEQDLYLAYSGTIPSGKSAMLLDDGPLVEGGAKISLTNGVSWLNLSTLNPSYAQYNIFISAMASENAPAQNAGQNRVAELGNVAVANSMVCKADLSSGVDYRMHAPARTNAQSATVPVVKGFNVYCNKELVAQVDGYEYSEVIKRYASFDYYVTTVFTNGWESNPSEVVSFANRVAQKSVAPYGLKGEVSGEDLVLDWQSPEKSTVLSYIPEGVELKALRMTSSGSTQTSYCAVKFTAADIKENVGKVVSHIVFGCGNTDVNSWEVFVAYGENIIYSQSVPVSSLVVGVNDVRLNEPVEIPAGTAVAVGYRAVYASSASIAPLGCYVSEEYPNLSDLISQSGSPDWQSLQLKKKAKYSWYIKCVLADADITLAPANAAANEASRSEMSYNVYRDGMLIDNTTETSYEVKNAIAGKYYVTAVSGDNESGESNAVVFSKTSGIDDITTDGLAVSFDRATSTITLGCDAVIEVYSMSGALVASGNGSELSVADLSAGVYMVKATVGSTTVFEKIVK